MVLLITALDFQYTAVIQLDDLVDAVGLKTAQKTQPL
jgi:hypothetical protein